MKTLKQIRTELGLSQKAMAVLLGISRNKLAMAEQGRQELPPPVMEYLEKIDIALSQTGHWEATGKEIAFYRDALEHLLRQAEGRQRVLDKKLQAVQAVQQSKIVRLHVLDYFAADLETPNPYPPMMHHAILQQVLELQDKLEIYDHKCSAVSFEIEAIKAELRKLAA